MNYKTNSVSMRFPRACLKTPKYVRVMHVSYRVRVRGESFRISYDDPTRTRGSIEQAGSKPTAWVVTGT